MMKKLGIFYKFRVIPETYHRGFCPALFDSILKARDYRDLMVSMTGFEWIIEKVKL